MKCIIRFLCILSCIHTTFLYTMRRSGKAQQRTLSIVRQERRIPLLDQALIVESMDGDELSMLAQGLLEKTKLIGKDQTRAKLLLHAAARKNDPLALYLSGQTMRSALSGYIPAMYMYSIKTVERILPSLKPEQQPSVRIMLETLSQHRLYEENALPTLQKKAAEAHCQLNIKDAQSESSIEEALAMLHSTVETYSQEQDILIKPWAMRAAYALGMLQKANICSSAIHSSDKLGEEPMVIAARDGFEPAIFETINRRVQHEEAIRVMLKKEFNSFIQAAKHLKEHSVSCLELDPYDIESILSDSIMCIRFLQIFGEPIQDIPLFVEAQSTLAHILENITEQRMYSDDYRAHCLLAILALYKRSPESIMQAYTLLEPFFNNPAMQLFLNSNMSSRAHKFLKEYAATNPQASFLLGLVLHVSTRTRLEAYHYFTLGAGNNHFYSLCSAAAMIRKGFDQEKNLLDAVIYYQKALASAPSQALKEHTLETIKKIAETGYIPARCLYAVTLLADSSKQEACNALIQSIEEYPDTTFNEHLACFASLFIKELSNEAEKGNVYAFRLLGYILHAAAHKESPCYIQALHSSLGKLRQSRCTTARSRSLAASIAFVLGSYYRESGNINNALRLFNIACEYNHPEAPCIRALLQLKLATSSVIAKDIKLVEQLADKGDLEAQELLAKLYSGAIVPFTEKLRPDEQRTYAYLENIVAHGTSDALCLVLLAKKICSMNKALDTKKALRAYEMFMQAQQQGYTFTDEDCKLLGMLAFTVHKDEQAQSFLEHCRPDKTTLWLLSTIYLRHPDEHNINFDKALHLLSQILIIEKDDIELPFEAENDLACVIHTLKENLFHSALAKELFIRLCYARGLDETIIASHELLQLAQDLGEAPSPSAWNLLVFLQRQGINIYDSVNQLLDIAHQVLYEQDIGARVQSEMKEQLTLLAQPLLNRRYGTDSLEDIAIAIRAAHFFVTLTYKTDLLTACTYFVMAEEATTMLFSRSHCIYNCANTQGSLDIIARLSYEQNQDACLALMMYRGYRHIREPNDTEKIQAWLRTSKYITDHYAKGHNKQRNSLMTRFYVLVGKINMLDKQTDLSSIKHYFEDALILDPNFGPAKAYKASIEVYNPNTSEKQIIRAIKTLQDLASEDNPEACFTLGKLYQPGATPLTGVFQITPNRELSDEYFKKAFFYAHKANSDRSYRCCTFL